MIVWYLLGPGCSKLATSLVNETLKFQNLISQIRQYFVQCKSFSYFVNKKYWRISDINVWNFNKTLTNDIVSFEQPGPPRKAVQKHT